jgi:hypothetical protein
MWRRLGSCCHPWEMAVAHRQVASIRNRICRAPRVMRAAMCRTPLSEGVDLAFGQNLENVPQRSSPITPDNTECPGVAGRA